jgi:glycosyltransferase involved in cell wall biosynthesis
VERLGLKKIVNLSTDFLKDSDSLAMLAKADLVVLPYQNTTESTSAAVRYALAAGRPVAVTPIAVFDDVDGAVFKLPGITSADLAAGIDLIAKKIDLKSEDFRTTMDTARRWRKEHLYQKLGYRMFKMLCAVNLQKKNKTYLSTTKGFQL